MNKKIRLLIITNSIFIFADTLILPMYALFIKKIGGGIELAGLLFGLKFLVSFIVSLFIVRLKDKIFLDDKMYKLNLFLRGLAWLSLVFFQTIPMLIVAQLMIGTSEAFGAPAFNTLFSENLDTQHHIKEWGMVELTYALSIALSSGISGYIVVFFGFRVWFGLMSLLALASLLLFNYRDNPA